MSNRDAKTVTERESYTAQARSWAEDRDAARHRSVRTAWIVAGVATGIAALEAFALIGLAPLKTVVPYTLLVDRNTGYVQMLDGTHPQTIKPDAALTQSLLAQYVIGREGFDIATIADQYRKVALWSAAAARRDYLALMPAGNPQSPLNLYPRSTQVRVTVESVSPIGPQAALVRFVAERRDQNGGAARQDYWVAVITYRYSGEPQKLDDRLANPLGFQVVSYRRDQETPPARGEAPVSNAPRAGAPVMAMPDVPGNQPVTMAAPATVDEPAQGHLSPMILRRAPWRIPSPAPRQIVTPGGGEP